MVDFKLAMVGCGGIGRAYGDAVASIDGAQLVSVVDLDAAARRSMAARTGAVEVADLTGLRGCDAALVLTPPNTHAQVTEALLATGVHVLCEKPLAPDLCDAERMFAAAKAAGRHLMMGSKFRYTPDVSEARGLLDQRVCGDVVLYENVFCSHVDMAQRWNGRREISGGGVLIDNGCHSVDIARYLLGPLAKVQAQFGRPVQPIDVEDTARMLFQSHSGALGSIDLSWSIHKQTDAYIRVIGTGGTLEIGWRGSRWKARDAEWQSFGAGYDKVIAFRNQLQNFIAVCRGEAAAVINEQDALASVAVISAAYQSASEERWVEIR